MKDGAALGKLAFVDDLPGPACLNSHLLLFRPRGDVYEPKYFFYVLTTDLFQGYIAINATGSTFLGVSQETVGNFELSLPPINVQRSLAEFLDRKTAAIDQLISKMGRQIETLREYRQALITAAITGKLDVDRAGSQTDNRVEQVAESV